MTPASGVWQKINGQCKAVVALGHECRLLKLAYDKTVMVEYTEEGPIIISDTWGHKKDSKSAQRKSVAKQLLCGIPSHIFVNVGVYNPSIIYVRMLAPAVPAYSNFLGQIKKKSHAKIYYELPTYPLTHAYQGLGLRGFFLRIFSFRVIERLRKIIDEFVVVAEINDEKQKSRLGRFSLISNGIDTSIYPMSEPPSLGAEINIIGVANLASWHGYDRIIQGIAEYDGPYKIVFHLVYGSGESEAQALHRLASTLNVQQNLVLYSELHGRGLGNLFNSCHVAAGSLGMHRIGLQNGATLKIREYCARSIPFFMSYQDEDFSDFEYACLFPPDESPIDMTKLSYFIEKVRLNIKYQHDMREYAERKLSWKAKMKRILDSTR